MIGAPGSRRDERNRKIGLCKKHWLAVDPYTKTSGVPCALGGDATCILDEIEPRPGFDITLLRPRSESEVPPRRTRSHHSDKGQLEGKMLSGSFVCMTSAEHKRKYACRDERRRGRSLSHQFSGVCLSVVVLHALSRKPWGMLSHCPMRTLCLSGTWCLREHLPSNAIYHARMKPKC